MAFGSKKNDLEYIRKEALNRAQSGKSRLVYDIQLSTLRLGEGFQDPIADVIGAIESVGWMLDRATMANTRWIGIFRRI